jgi:hypothetical protein
LSSNKKGNHIDSIENKYFFNSSEYLFISTNIAKLYPNLIESLIISNYHTHLPGEMSKKWINEDNYNTLMNIY